MNLVRKDKILIIILYFIIAVKIECKDSFIPITFNTEFSYNKSTKLPEKGINLNAYFGIMPNQNPYHGVINDFKFLKLGSTISFDPRVKDLYEFSLTEIDLFKFLKNYNQEKEKVEIEEPALIILAFLLSGNYARYMVKLMDYKEGVLFDYKMDWFKLGAGIGRYGGSESFISYNILYHLGLTTFKPGSTYYFLWDNMIKKNVNESLLDTNVITRLEIGLALSAQMSFSKYFSILLNIDYSFLPSSKNTGINSLSFNTDIMITFYKKDELSLSVPAADLFFRYSVRDCDYNGYTIVRDYRLGISLPIPNTGFPVKYPVTGYY